ncbi:hypothetical protein V8F20_003733 [Naviculisporaceae sp. PSN 640]
MSSRTEPGEPAPGQHICSNCAKPFARLCDLNKHAKSHSRPFKCAITTCKYHEHGWPTAKELERHINDKHSVAPRTFACRFPPCTYKSKRESNCKQHMEKTHRWKYVRSKSNGKQPSGHHRDISDHRLDIPGVKSFSAMTSPSISLGSPHQDFVLYPYENDADGDDYDPPRGQDSQVYLPWTSPNTRLRRNENFLETFSQTYNGAPDRPAGSTDSLIDPSLPRYTAADLPGPELSDPANIYTPKSPIKTEMANTGTGQLHASQPDSRRGSLAGNYRYPQTPQTIQTAAYPSSGREQSMVTLAPTADRRSSYSMPKPTLARRRVGEDEESGDDSQSPKKRPRSNPVENFSDTDMPDIFRFAHPHIYDRDQKEKFSPCHSSHRDISTLVRHLSRPAHRLQVTDRFISSFEVDDPGYRHPRLGLCRRCWEAFPDREEFQAHLSRTCDKVSKGKREKWRILLENFTPIIHNSDTSEQMSHPLNSEQRRSSIASRRPSNVPSHAEHLAAPSFPAAPGINTAPHVCHSGCVPLSEHLKLQGEHRVLNQQHRQLCQRHQQLVQVTRSLLQRQAYQDSLTASAQRPGGNLWAALPSDQQPGLGSGAAAQSTNSSDQESLVLHMDSQPTDVDIQGLMNEASESLSRHNSGLSDMSRSTIHHVPNSPPPLPADQDGSDYEDETDKPKQPSPSRRPPSSIPDSAYGTDPRRGSLQEQGCGEGAVSGSGVAQNSSRRPSQHHDLGHMVSMGEMSVNRRKPAAAAAVMGSTGDEMFSIAWNNPWGQSEAPTATQQATATSMAHHTFMNGGTTVPLQQDHQASEPAPNFEFLNMELDHFDWGN